MLYLKKVKKAKTIHDIESNENLYLTCRLCTGLSTQDATVKTILIVAYVSNYFRFVLSARLQARENY